MNSVVPRSRRRRTALLALLVVPLLTATGPTVSAAPVLPATDPLPTSASDSTAAHSTATATPAAGDLGFAVKRIAGGNRYSTAAALSRAFYSPGVDTVLVASGSTFPDGLAAGPAADQLGGPVLFVTRTSIPTATRTELARLDPGRILVIGGPGTISETVRTELAGLADSGATRVAGDDRAATSAAVSQQAFPGGAAVAYVAGGQSFPDALSGGAAAGVQGAPMLLTSPGALPASVRAELVRLDPDRIMVLGGPSSVSAAVLTDLSAIATTERVSGSDRYRTALAVSQRVFGPDRPAVLVADGRSFPDALAGGAVTRFTRGPILLTGGSTLPLGMKTELTRLGPDTAYLLGGGSAVPVGVAKEVQRRLGVCWSGPSFGPGSQEVIGQVSGTDSKKIAFTLDMGGRLDGATDIVDYLVEHQVCTTFFPTSIMADTAQGRAVMAKIARHPELFEVGNHTVHHCDLVLGGGGSPTSAPCDRTMTSTFIRSELTDAQTVLEARSGGMQITPYWRPPYGSHNAFVRDNAAAVGYTKTVVWSRDTIDWDPSTTTAQIVSRATSPLPPSGTIVLSHLGGYHTPEALPQIVTKLRANGYTMTTVSDMRDG